jgi:hypothetical protein
MRDPVARRSRTIYQWVLAPNYLILFAYQIGAEATHCYLSRQFVDSGAASFRPPYPPEGIGSGSRTRDANTSNSTLAEAEKRG